LRMVTNPRRIFGLAEQPDNWIEVDPDESWKIPSDGYFSRCNWTPFAGWQGRGRLKRVVLRGQEVYKDDQVLAQPGFGINIKNV
jgi:dihydroorotase-like cyclic amidohydrolase